MPFESGVLLIPVPELSDETAARLLDFLQDLAREFEHHYAAQIRRHYHSIDPQQPALRTEENPPF